VTVQRNDAAAALQEIAAVETRTRESLFYSGSSSIFITWGVLGVVGYLYNWYSPRHAFPAWMILNAIGFVATFGILGTQIPRARWRQAGLRWGAAFVAFEVYGYLMFMTLAPRTARQAALFWPMLVMFGYVLMGIWLGRVIAWLGVTATALILFGYFQLGEWFLPWLALVYGGGLIAGGLWLRRAL
jgi:hypothetical protein